MVDIHIEEVQFPRREGDTALVGLCGSLAVEAVPHHDMGLDALRVARVGKHGRIQAGIGRL